MPAQSIIPPGIKGYVESYKNPYRGRDIEQAKKLLEKAGYPNGAGLPEITYDCPSSTVARQMGDFFRKNMADIGVKIKVVQNSWRASK